MWDYHFFFLESIFSGIVALKTYITKNGTISDMDGFPLSLMKNQREPILDKHLKHSYLISILTCIEKTAFPGISGEG